MSLFRPKPVGRALLNLGYLGSGTAKGSKVTTRGGKILEREAIQRRGARRAGYALGGGAMVAGGMGGNSSGSRGLKPHSSGGETLYR